MQTELSSERHYVMLDILLRFRFEPKKDQPNSIWCARPHAALRSNEWMTDSQAAIECSRWLCDFRPILECGESNEQLV